MESFSLPGTEDNYYLFQAAARLGLNVARHPGPVPFKYSSVNTPVQSYKAAEIKYKNDYDNEFRKGIAVSISNVLLFPQVRVETYLSPTFS